jgi:hypothetical protein
MMAAALAGGMLVLRVLDPRCQVTASKLETGNSKFGK